MTDPTDVLVAELRALSPEVAEEVWRRLEDRAFLAREDVRAALAEARSGEGLSDA